MAFPFPSWEMLRERRPLLLYAAAWTALLTAAVAVASSLPEVAFVWAVSPSSSFSRACGDAAGGLVRVPLDVPGEVLCLPALLFGRSKLDLLVPPVFAAVVVTASALLVRAVGLWEEEEDDDDGERS
ncbi:hypothetical protein Taro_007105 [Colocasia esculenta]|uniref:Uncharacterized protein n=1 Tax=Colocasia esculenta TaxID=4460 RepID=A0A843TZD3_COLES|nr:hypothetical protein [Colocasia esculenta]